MPVRNVEEAKKAKKSFQIQLDKAQIKDLRGRLAALKKLNKELFKPVQLTENLNVEILLDDDVFFDLIPTIHAKDFNFQDIVYTGGVYKKSKSSKLSDLEGLIVSLWDYAEFIDNSGHEPMKSAIERIAGVMEAQCKEFNDFFLGCISNGEAISKTHADEFLNAIACLTSDESIEFIEGLLKGQKLEIY